MRHVKVLLAASGPISSARLSRTIGQIPDLKLIGHALDLSQAYILAEACEPEVAVIGPELTRHPEFEGLLTLFHILGTCWLEVDPELPTSENTATNGAAGANLSGASPLLPSAAARSRRFGPADPAPIRVRSGMTGPELLSALQRARMRGEKASPATPRPLPIAQSSTNAAHRPDRPPQRREIAGSGFDPAKLVLIGASTGGIDALMTILAAFPADCPPTAVVQHTGAAFSASLIRLFRRCTPARILAAEAGIALVPGTIVIGAGSSGHLGVLSGQPYSTTLRSGPPISGHLPSVDALFQSAVPFGRDVVATLLTGMGRDGARGLLDLHRAGAATIAQDEASSVVYGMPKAAADLGAAGAILPLDQIAGEILSLCRRPQATTSRRAQD